MPQLAEADPIDATWRSWSGAHGGLLAGLLLDHANREVPHLSPRALHVSFLNTVRGDRVHAGTELIRAGRSSATVRAELHADDRIAVIGTATFGAATAGPGYPATDAPAAPHPDEARPLPSPVELVPFTQYLEFRQADDNLPLAGGSEAVITNWLRLSLPVSTPEAAACVLLDSLAPALYAVRTAPIPVPTVEFAIHFTPAAPTLDAKDWNLVRIRTEHAGDGWCVDASEVWSSAGVLLATGRQSRRVLDGD